MRVILHYLIYANTKKVSIQNYQLFVSSYPFIPKLPSPRTYFWQGIFMKSKLPGC